MGLTEEGYIYIYLHIYRLAAPSNGVLDSDMLHCRAL